MSSHFTEQCMKPARKNLMRSALYWTRSRQGEFGKLATFFIFYALYAWKACNNSLCDLFDPVKYPCTSSLDRNPVVLHACKAGVILSAVFLKPRDPADRHDGLSCVTFFLGGLISVVLGPTTADGRRSCNWRFGWLLSCVLVPKGFLIGYGLAYPSASMGYAVNMMLPRHTAIMLWLSFAFPLVWRRQALLASVYVTHMLLVILLAATRTGRPWPYKESLLSPVLVSIRLVLLSSLSVAVTAVWDCLRARQAARAVATQKIVATDATTTEPTTPWADGDAEQSGKCAVPTDAARRLASLRQRRGATAAAAAAAAAGSCFDNSAGGGSVGNSDYAMYLGGDGGLCTDTLGDRGLGSASSQDVAASHAELQRQASNRAASPSTAPVCPGIDTAHVALPQVAADVDSFFLRYRPPRPSRYRSATRSTRMYLKVNGATPLHLNSDVFKDMSEHLASRGFLLADFAVRSGCIEVVLELLNLRGSGGGEGRHGVLVPDLIRRIVFALAGATGGAAAAVAAAAKVQPVKAQIGNVSYLLDYVGRGNVNIGCGNLDDWQIRLDDGLVEAVSKFGDGGDSDGSCQESSPRGTAPLLAAALPPCLSLPSTTAWPRTVGRANAGSGGLTTVPSGGPEMQGESDAAMSAVEWFGETEQLEFTLIINAPHCCDEDRGSWAATQRQLPEVLAWQRGCFLKVIRVDEVWLLGTQGTAFYRPHRSYRIWLDTREISSGLIYFAFRNNSASRFNDVDAATATADAMAAAGAAIPLRCPPGIEFISHALILPPGLNSIADELQRPLAEDAVSAVIQQDSDGVQSVADFLTDMAMCLTSHGTTVQGFLQPHRVLNVPSRQLAPSTLAVASVASGDSVTTAVGLGDPSATTSSASCTRALGPGEMSCMRENESTLSGSLASGGIFRGMDVTPDLVDNDTVWYLPFSCEDQVPYIHDRFNSSVDYADPFHNPCVGEFSLNAACGHCGGSGCIKSTGLAVIQSWETVTYDNMSGGICKGEGEERDPGSHARVAQMAGVVSMSLPPSSATAAAAAKDTAKSAVVEAGSRMLDGGRLDLRDVAADTVRLSRVVMNETPEGQRVQDERRWLLLEHAVQCGWPATVQLLLGLYDDDDDDDDDDGTKTRNGESAGNIRQLMQLKELGAAQLGTGEGGRTWPSATMCPLLLMQR